MLETTVHEITHILGFSNQMIQYFRDPSTGSPYAAPTITKTIRTINTTYLTTPKVK